MKPAEAMAFHEQFLEKRLERLQQTVSLFQNRARILEEENARLVALLMKHGVAAQTPSPISAELPPPIIHPLQKSSDIFNRLTTAERKLSEDLAENSDIFLLLGTDSKTDTGLWFRRARIWVLALAHELGLFAAGKQPFLAKIGFAHLQESLYNHITGEVILAPARGLAINTLKMPPLDGYQLLAQIYADKK